MKLYGSLNNRFDEGKNYTNRDIQAGDDITMYHYSDRSCYYITKVLDQKHIFVKQYHVCADHSKQGGMGHQNWVYCKSSQEEIDYLSKYFPDIHREPQNDSEEEWVFRNNKWKQAVRWDKESIEEMRKKCSWLLYPTNFTEKDKQKIEDGKEVVKYISLSPISFGVRDYYWDWSF